MLTITDLLDHVVIKQKAYADKIDRALKAKGIDAFKEFQQLLEAYLGNDSLVSYTYTIDDLTPYTQNIHQISMMLRSSDGPYAMQRFLTEEQLKELLLKKRVDTVVNYVEKNPYYRLLLGLPSLITKEVYDEVTKSVVVTHEENEAEFYYIKDKIVGADTSIPVHKWTRDQKKLLSTYKFPEADLARYPYLKYLPKTIDIFRLRNGDYFELVWTDIKRGTKNIRMLPFIEHYRLVRNFYMANHLSIYDLQNSEYYERIQCVLLFLATLANTNARYPLDKLDNTVLKVDEVYQLFGSYGIPKFRFTPKYLNAVAAKLNSFIYEKGTNKDLEDISKVFNDIKLFKYFLIKSVTPGMENLDPNDPKYINNPSKYNEDKYTLRYVKTPLDVDEPYEYINEDNVVDFREVAEADKLWGDPSSPDDKKLEKELKNTEFAWVESKYLGIDNTIKLGWDSLKAATLTRWIFENRGKLNRYKLYYEYADVETDIYSLLVYLQCLIFKKFNKRPDIPDTLNTVWKLITIAEDIDREAIVPILETLHPRAVKNESNTEFNNTYINDMFFKDMSYADLNLVLSEYYNRHALYENTRITGKMMHIDPEREIRERSEYRNDNLYYTNTDDRASFLAEEEDYTAMLADGVTTYEIRPRNIHKKNIVDFLNGNNPDELMHNLYSKFEVNFNIITYLHELRNKAKTYKEYQSVDALLRAFHIGKKMEEMFTYHNADGTKKVFTDMEEYLATLHPKNVAFIQRMKELEDDTENRLAGYNNEIVEVINTMREALNPDYHHNSDDALNLLQTIYADNEVLNYLETLVTFFKSYTQDIVTKGVKYLLDDGNNVIKALDQIDQHLKINEWDFGSVFLMMNQYPTEVIDIIRYKTRLEEEVVAGERVEYYCNISHRWVELVSSGLKLT